MENISLKKLRNSVINGFNKSLWFLQHSNWPSGLGWRSREHGKVTCRWSRPLKSASPRGSKMSRAEIMWMWIKYMQMGPHGHDICDVCFWVVSLFLSYLQQRWCIEVYYHWPIHKCLPRTIAYMVGYLS